jgi:predicted nuclease of restriction endonuclease-like (RecB) superfamily
MSPPPARRTRSDLDAVAGSAPYRELLERLRQRIRESQARAARTLNRELVLLYWSIGRDILAQQQASDWGDNVVGRIARDLAADTGSPRGFTRRNLFYMRRFAELWPDPEKVPSVMAQIPWTAHRTLLDSFANQSETYIWYAHKAAEQRWSVRQLKAQIDLKLHQRHGAALTNFTEVLEPDDATAALHATKDPYVFDFLELTEDVRERELEQALIDDIQKLLIELGTGFAFYGRQKPVVVGGEEFFLDLLFYHHTLRRFVVIELKIGRFQPEHVAKMDFYLNAIDEQLRLGDDRESVGIILCTDRNETVAKLALHRVYARLPCRPGPPTDLHATFPPSSHRQRPRRSRRTCRARRRPHKPDRPPRPTRAKAHRLRRGSALRGDTGSNQ